MAHVAIAGGGPAGLAAAIEIRRRGLDVTVFERRRGPLDKPCGEGLMPSAVRALERLGAFERVPAAQRAPFRGIRYVREDGLVAEGRFRSGPGYGIRRTALSLALRAAAELAGARLVDGVAVRGARNLERSVEVTLSGETLECDFLVAADGLLSPLRRSLGLEREARKGSRRFGLRRHFVGVRVDDWVEVHWADGVEAYLTPVGSNELGVAFLWSEGGRLRPGFESFLAGFPAVARRLHGGRPSSPVLGVGSMARRARAAQGRIALVGDAAGYVDALAGEGLGIAFRSAALLGEELPAWLAGDPAAPARYARRRAAMARRHGLATEALLWLADRPAVRRRAIGALAAFPACFDAALELLQPN